jgi:hypothetical protein
MVTGLRGTSYEDKCKELGLQTLKARRLEQDLSLAHKFIDGDIEGGSSICQKMNQQERITRQAVDASSLVTQYARTDTRKFSFGVRVVEPWNGLDSNTETAGRTRHSKTSSRLDQALSKALGAN